MESLRDAPNAKRTTPATYPRQVAGTLPPAPVAGSLVCWANAWLAGHIGADEVADSLERVHGPQLVVGNAEGQAHQPLRTALGELRAGGVHAFRLALPAPGDPLGLAGPAEFNRAAVDARQAVLVDLDAAPLGLVPHPDTRGSSYAGTRWDRYDLKAAQASTPTLSEAEQQLALSLRAAADALTDLDVARWNPEAAEALAAIRTGGDHAPPLAPCYSPRAQRVATQAARLAAISALGLADDGGAITGWEADARRAALRDLERAVRRAQVAAYNSVAEPPDGPDSQPSPK